MWKHSAVTCLFEKPLEHIWCAACKTTLQATYRHHESKDIEGDDKKNGALSTVVVSRLPAPAESQADTNI